MTIYRNVNICLKFEILQKLHFREMSTIGPNSNYDNNDNFDNIIGAIKCLNILQSISVFQWIL